DLDQTLILAERDGLAVADKGEAADADVELLVLARLLGQPDGGDLRRAIGAAWDHQFVHRVRIEALDRLDADDALVLGLVREHWRPGHVADSVDAGDIGLAVAVDDDAAALGLHAELLEAEILDVADDADGGDDALGRDLLGLAIRLDGGGDAVGLLVEFADLGVREDFNALLLEALAREGLDLVVLDGQDLRQHFAHGHVGSKRAIERGELDADRAGADDEQRLWNRRRHHRLEIGP